MLLKDEVEMLRKVPLFGCIDITKLRLLAFTSDRLRFSTGEIIFDQGQIGDSAYVVIDGRVSLLIQTPAGRVKIGEEGRHGIIGEMSMICDECRNVSAVAATDVDLLRIDRDCFMRLIAACPKSTLATIRALGERLQQANEGRGSQQRRPLFEPIG